MHLTLFRSINVSAFKHLILQIFRAVTYGRQTFAKIFCFHSINYILFVHDVIYILYIYKIYNKVMFLPIRILSITSLHKTLGSTCLKEFRRGVITCALPSTSSLTLGKVSFFFPFLMRALSVF